MKKSIAILVVFIIILCLCSCGVPVEDAAKETIYSTDGRFAFQGNRIFFSYNDGIYSMDTDGGDKRKLTENWSPWFRVVGDRIYYGYAGALYSINTDGGNNKKLNDNYPSGLFYKVIGGKIYYSNNYDGFKFYTMNTDGSDNKKLNDDFPLYMNVVGDRIYYYNGHGGGIYGIKTDGSEKVKLSDDKPYMMTVSDGWIYYNNESDDHKLYVMRTDGSDRRKLTHDYAPRMSIVDDLIYYVDGSEWKIYRMKTDGSERQLLSDDHINGFAVCGELIYYTMTGSKIYTMNTNGGDRQILVDINNDNPYRDVKYEISSRLYEDMPEYRFTATGMTKGIDEWGMGFVMGLDVRDENGLSLITANFSENFYDEVAGCPVYNQMMDTMGLHVVDVNFDGYKDVIILNNFAGAHSNTWYNCWLWDAKKSSFAPSQSFAEICNPALDPVKKCIYSTGGSGAAYWGGSIYKFINGEFVITNDLDTDWDGLVETKLVNGKMEVVRKVSYGDDDRDKIIAEEQEYYKKHELWQLEYPHWYWYGGHHADQWLEQ